MSVGGGDAMVRQLLTGHVLSGRIRRPAVDESRAVSGGELDVRWCPRCGRRYNVHLDETGGWSTCSRCEGVG